MSYRTDELAETLEELLDALANGHKSIAIKTGIGGGKLLTIVDTPKPTVSKDLTG